MDRIRRRVGYVELIKSGIFWLDELSQISPIFSHISSKFGKKIGKICPKCTEKAPLGVPPVASPNSVANTSENSPQKIMSHPYIRPGLYSMQQKGSVNATPYIK